MEETARQPVRCLLEALSEERDLSAREEARRGQSPRMLLMDLLEETDRQVCFEFTEYALLEEDGKEESCGVGEANNCCVCMVRRKGAAFIPCGHTFCRLCSRELWVSRGTCPICNGSIQEVLDIF
ncbi:hypothetical protein MLD38_040063 [Melastoma candidum]|nr:hypothetical protein MLD38_040063 [Melastoma candidum]